MKYWVLIWMALMPTSAHSDVSCRPSSPNYYSFHTDWNFEAPIQRVFDVIVHPEVWPAYWPNLKSVGPSFHEGTFEARDWSWKAPFGYILRHRSKVDPTLDVHAPYRIHASTSGDLEGEGEWTLESTERGTHVHYRWDVCPTLFWMRLLQPIARPFFKINHDATMKNGRAAFQAILDNEPSHGIHAKPQ